MNAYPKTEEPERSKRVGEMGQGRKKKTEVAGEGLRVGRSPLFRAMGSRSRVEG